MEEEWCGKAARLLINNHLRNRPTAKAEVKAFVGVTNSGLNAFLGNLQAFVNELSLELVGLHRGRIVPIEKCDKLFLRRVRSQTNVTEPEQAELSIEIKQRYLLFSILQVENSTVEEKSLDVLKNCEYFKDAEVREALKREKALGYLSSVNNGEDILWSLGWRYYVEYGDVFDVVEFHAESFRSIC